MLGVAQGRGDDAITLPIFPCSFFVTCCKVLDNGKQTNPSTLKAIPTTPSTQIVTYTTAPVAPLFWPFQTTLAENAASNVGSVLGKHQVMCKGVNEVLTSYKLVEDAAGKFYYTYTCAVASTGPLTTPQCFTRITPVAEYGGLSQGEACVWFIAHQCVLTA